MHIVINTHNLHNVTVNITGDAAKEVRMNFNPSALEDVERLKALAAAFISECDRLGGISAEGSNDFAIATIDARKACMMAVAGATAHLNK